MSERGLLHDAASVRALATQVSAAGERLWRAGPERRAHWLADAFAMLRDRHSTLGREARRRLPESTGLSEAMVDWALESALAPLTADALCALDQAARAPHPGARRVRPGQLCVVVLAGNVFTAAARGVGLPLLFGWPVLAKASSHDPLFAKLLEAALSASDPELGAAYRSVVFARDEALTEGTPLGTSDTSDTRSESDPRLAALFEQADAVSAYGSDRTLNALRAQLGATVTFIPHGHGLGAAFIGAPALADEERANDAARALAFDAAAYDQRGCLSPLVAWVTQGAPVSLERFAELVHAAFDRLRTELPRGALPLDVASAQLSWRGVGAIRGRLLEGDGFAVWCEASGPLRLSPGYRNLQLIGIEGAHALRDRLAPLGVHLKCLGVTGLDDVEALIAELPTRVAPRLCPLGSMQTPPLHALHDGVAPWEGLLRWAER
jgi:hypothetical protein